MKKSAVLVEHTTPSTIRARGNFQKGKKTAARRPVTALVDQFYAQVQARGGSRWDTSSLMQLLAKD